MRHFSECRFRRFLDQTLNPFMPSGKHSQQFAIDRNGRRLQGPVVNLVPVLPSNVLVPVLDEFNWAESGHPFESCSVPGTKGNRGEN